MKFPTVTISPRIPSQRRHLGISNRQALLRWPIHYRGRFDSSEAESKQSVSFPNRSLMTLREFHVLQITSVHRGSRPVDSIIFNHIPPFCSILPNINAFLTLAAPPCFRSCLSVFCSVSRAAWVGVFEALRCTSLLEVAFH